MSTVEEPARVPTIPRDLMVEMLIGRGWTKGEPIEDQSESLFGVLRHSLGGEAFLIEQIWEGVGRGMVWHDAPETTFDDVATWIWEAPDITPADMEHVFGPNWPAVRQVVHRAAVFTKGDRHRLSNAMRGRSKGWTKVFRETFQVVSMLPVELHWDSAMRAGYEAADAALLEDMVEDYAWMAGVTAATLAIKDIFGKELPTSHGEELLSCWRLAIEEVSVC